MFDEVAACSMRLQLARRVCSADLVSFPPLSILEVTPMCSVLANCRFFLPIFAVLILAVQADGGVLYKITFENDGVILSNPLGTIDVDGSVANRLTFTIDVIEGILGPNNPNIDIHQFGFQLSGFSGTLTLNPTVEQFNNVPIQLFQYGVDPDNALRVAGMGNTEFDYLVDLGSGSPQIEPVRFTLEGTGLSLANLVSTDTVTTNTGKVTNFGIHVQNTSFGNVTSEALGGLWTPTVTVTQLNAAVAPEPNSLLIGLLLTAFAVSARRRKRVSA